MLFLPDTKEREKARGKLERGSRGCQESSEKKKVMEDHHNDCGDGMSSLDNEGLMDMSTPVPMTLMRPSPARTTTIAC